MMETADEVRKCILGTQACTFVSASEEFVSGWDAALDYVKDCIDGNYPPSVIHDPQAA